jgi:hypothetical protein
MGTRGGAFEVPTLAAAVILRLIVGQFTTTFAEEDERVVGSLSVPRANPVGISGRRVASRRWRRARVIRVML